MSEEPPGDVPARLRQLVDEAAAVGAGPRRTELLTEGLLNFGRDLLVLVTAERRRDEARFDAVYAEMHARCRSWLMGDALGRGADEDARRARFALWFCGLHPALARVAARIVFKLPEGIPTATCPRCATCSSGSCSWRSRAGSPPAARWTRSPGCSSWTWWATTARRS